MVKPKPRKLGLLSAVCLAVVAMFAFGAGSAQAAWHVNGTTLSGEETFSSTGTYTMEVSGFGTKVEFTSCKETGTGTVAAPEALSMTLTLSGCKLTGVPACVVKPIVMKLTGSMSSLASAEGTILTKVEFEKECSWFGSSAVLSNASFALSYGSNGVALPVTTTGTAQYGTHTWSFSGSSNWILTGSHAGQQWGTQPPQYAHSITVGSKGSGNAQFDEPWGVATDTSGNAWVTDARNNRVQKFNSNGEYVSQFGTEGSSNGQLKKPRGIAIDGSGNLWIADGGNNRVQKFNSKGEYVSQFPAAGWGIAVDPEGNIWVLNYEKVRKYNPKGELLLQFGSYGTGNGQFDTAYFITANAKGSIWVSDRGNDRVQGFNLKGEYLSQFGSAGSGPGQLSAAMGIAADPSGNLWVADGGRVEGFSAGGLFESQFGTAGSGVGQMIGARGVASDSAGNLWVVDGNNNRIQKWTH